MREVDTGPHLVPTAGPQITRLTFQYHTTNHKGFDAGGSDEKMLDIDKKWLGLGFGIGLEIGLGSTKKGQG